MKVQCRNCHQLQRRLAEAEAALRKKADIEAALRESQQRQAYLLTLTDALRPLADPGLIQDTAARILGERLGADRTYYARIDTARELGIVERDYVRDNAPSVVGEYRLSDFMPIIETFRAGQPFIADDVEALASIPSSDFSTYRALSLRSMVGIPLIKDGDIVAAMCVLKVIPHHWSEHEISLVQETAERTWGAVERAGAERALRESEERLALLFSLLPVGVAVLDPGGNTLMSNKEMRRFLPAGVIPSRDPARHARWTGFHADGARIEPNDFATQRALRGELVVPGLEMLYRQDDGHEIWVQVAAAPMINDDQEIVGAFVVMLDIDMLKRAETRQATLLHELQHRVRNTLAMIRSIVRRTVTAQEDAAEISRLLEGRLNALARTQARLGRAMDMGVDLESLIREELSAQSADEARISIRGDRVVLAPKPVEVLTLAIHELVTNATKYGAIGQNGSISVVWGIEAKADSTHWLRLEWIEAGVQVPTNTPPRRGFGTELLEERVPYDLEGVGHVELRPGGVRAEIAFPLIPRGGMLKPTVL